MSCREICEKLRGTKPPKGKGRYSSGQKFCVRCDLFIVCAELRCPCCNVILRVKPRHQKNNRDGFRESLEVLIR